MTEAPTAPSGQNRLGLTKADYDGAKTTLCPGCGHNAITGGITVQFGATTTVTGDASVGTDTLTTKAKVVQRSRFNFLREAQIWYNRQPDQRVLGEDFENIIVLSDEFYQEITRIRFQRIWKQ